MAAVSVTTTPVTLDSGTAAELVIENTGALSVYVQPAGVRLRSGQSRRLQTGGKAVTAYTQGAAGSTVNTTAVGAPFTQPAARLTQFRSLGPVCARGSGPLGTAASGLLGGTNRQFFPLLDQSASYVTVLPVWENYLGGTDAAGANPVSVAAAVEVGSAVVPFTFAGAHLAVLQPGGTLLPDVGIQVPAVSVAYAAGAGTGTVKGVWIRTYVAVTSGQTYPVNAWPGLVSGEVIGESAAGAGDLTVPGSAAPVSGGGGFAAGFGPRAVLGKALGSRLLVGVGDSKLNGQGDTPNMYGYLDRAAVTAKLAVVKLGRPGDTIGNFVPTQRYRRAAWFDGATDALLAYGVNDLVSNNRTPAQVIGDITNAAQWLTDLGVRVHRATIGPRTTSTDSWATTGNQTATGAAGTIDAAKLATVNDTIRGLIGGAVGCFDVADLEMSARNSGLWVPAATTDGVHPTAARHLVEAAAFVSYIAAA